MAGKAIFTPEERFWQRVVKTNSCWEWQRLNEKGYGSLNVNRRLEYAHRYSWILHNGAIPDGLWVLHRCDNRACVNPAHLFLGTAKDNVVDMWAKGRQRFDPPKGERNGAAKLSEDDVRFIRELLARKIPHRVIARIMKVSRSNISLISEGRAWKHNG